MMDKFSPCIPSIQKGNIHEASARIICLSEESILSFFGRESALASTQSSTTLQFQPGIGESFVSVWPTPANGDSRTFRP